MENLLTMTSQVDSSDLLYLEIDLDEIQRHRIKFFKRNGIPFEIVNHQVVRRKKRNEVLNHSLSYDIHL